MRKSYSKHGKKWPDRMPDWIIEIACIRMGGVTGGKRNSGNLFKHYKLLQQAIWPDHHYHRWSDLQLKESLQNMITPVLGPKSSGKTHQAAKWALCEYICYPECTSVIVSSTTIPALERRIWGEIKKLWGAAKKQMQHDCPGHLIDHKHVIASDDIKDSDSFNVRDLRNGIMGIAMKQGGVETALANFVGIKNKRVIMVGDECQFMPPGFLEAIANLDVNPYFKAGLLGNPKDPFDQLGKAAEPVNGWSSQDEPTKTTCWKIRFENSRAVNLVGTDSPNYDYPQDEPPRFPELVNAAKVKNVVSFWGEESHQYYTQCKGVMKTGLLARRIITRELCIEHNAMLSPEWRNPIRRHIAGLDVAYGGIGGDRCIYTHAQFGEAPDGTQIFCPDAPIIVPVSVAVTNVTPEDQIARWLKLKLESDGVHPIDCFYDSTGRGTIGSAFARVFGYVIPTPVEFGGNPTKRPVREDMKVKDEDGRMRHKRCDEHYRKFVTELWYSVRYCVETGQMRGLVNEVIDEGSKREWSEVAGGKLEIETKAEMKERVDLSPDLFDSLVTTFEGARQRGFKIIRLGGAVLVEDDRNNWLAELQAKQYKREKSRQLTYA